MVIQLIRDVFLLPHLYDIILPLTVQEGKKRPHSLPIKGLRPSCIVTKM